MIRITYRSAPYDASSTGYVRHRLECSDLVSRNRFRCSAGDGCLCFTSYAIITISLLEMVVEPYSRPKAECSFTEIDGQSARHPRLL
jgi:hypothetical protein